MPGSNGLPPGPAATGTRASAGGPTASPCGAACGTSSSHKSWLSHPGSRSDRTSPAGGVSPAAQKGSIRYAGLDFPAGPAGWGRPKNCSTISADSAYWRAG